MGALFKIYKSDGITEITNIKSVVYREAVNTGEHLRPGCVCSASVDVEVFNTQANAVSAGDVIYAYSYDNANNGTLLGKFNCEPKIDTKNSYKFTAYDNALKLNADFSQWLQANQSSFPMTVKQLVQQACTIAGVTLGSSSWPLSMQSVQAFYADGLTCRDVLSYAAELAGRFVRCHTDGSVYFDWYTTNSNSIAPASGTGVYAYKQDGLTYANYTTTALARVAVHPSGEDDVAYVYPTDRPSGNTLHIKNNLLLTGADASFYNAAAKQVYTAVTAVGSYCPMSVSLFPRENPFHAGDIVSITDAQGVTISAPITGMTISNAAATLLSEGRENYEDTTETAKAIAQLASDVVRINKLKVGYAEMDTAVTNSLIATGIDASQINVTNLNASNITSGTISASKISAGTLASSSYIKTTGTDSSDRQRTAEVGSGMFSFTTPYNASGFLGFDEGKAQVSLTQNGHTSYISGDGGAEFWGDVTMNESLSVGDQLSCYDLSVQDNVSIAADATIGGTATITGGVVSDSYYTRKVPVPVANTTYLVCRLEDSNGDGRGGVGFITSNNYGEGTRLYHTRNGVVNGLALYVDSNGTPTVNLGQPAAWRDALGIVADYKAGDTVSFPSSGNNSYYQRFHGDWRYAYTLYFFIPLARSCEGLSASVSGTVYVVTNKTRSSVNLSNVATVNCFCAPGGVAVQLNWGSGNAPSYGQSQYDIASVQPYGMTITFS